MLAELGFDPEMGARPLRRVIQNRVEDRLSDMLLTGEFKDGSTVVVDVEDDDLVLTRGSSEPSEQEEALATS